MLPEIKELQYNSISSLYNKIVNQREVTFKAPTGSGKTYMMADLMNRILPNSNVVFIVSSLSKAELAKQNYEKFIQYETIFPNLNPFMIKSDYTDDEKIYIPEDYNVYVLPRDLYKKKAKIKESGALLNLLMSLRFDGKEVYLIKDECHIATSNLDELNDQFTKIINFSATPKFKPDVEITDDEAVNCKLIKRLADISTEDGLLTVKENATVEDAINKFIQVKDEYINKLKVNPCLIIQISNKDKAEEEWAKIKKIIDDPNKNLKWMYIVDNNNGKGCDTNDAIKKLPVSKWKDFVKNPDSLIDIIVFKMVITEGWDIPRACMLYQVRDSQSTQMDEQVIGRVRRNPILLNWNQFDEEAHKLALTSWVWGIVDSNLRKFKKVTVIKERNINVKTTSLNTVSKKSDFDIPTYVRDNTQNINSVSIFDLNRKWNKISQDTSDICWDNIKTFKDWVEYSNLLDSIERENNSYMSDYKNSIYIDGVASFPESSYFELTNSLTEISDWSWKLNDNEDEEYHFDSDAEKEWAKILKKFNYPKWGKNFYPNSKIKFDYVLYNKHSSYPDFILEDKNNKVHIFEVKSVNERTDSNIDEAEYKKKIEALKEMFLVASSVTNQIFYLPIKTNNDWVIYQMLDGVEKILTKSSFIEYFESIL